MIRSSFLSTFYPKWKLIIPIVVLVLVLLYAFAYFLHINGDESILAEQAQMLFLNGKVSSPMFEGLQQGWELSQLHYHKLYIWLGALGYGIFGASLYGFRLIPLFFACFSFVLIFRYLKYNGQSWYEFGLGLLILLFNYTFFSFGIIYRPEIALVFFSLFSFFNIYQYLKTEKNAFVFLSAVASGMGMLSHLNGVSICFAGFVVLLIYKKYWIAFVHGFISAFVALFYFVDINSLEKLQQFFTQFGNDPNLNSTDFSVFGPFFKLLDEHMRFFWSPNSSVFSVLLIFVLIFSWKHLIKNYRFLLIYSGLLNAGLAMVAHGKNENYGLLTIPFYVLIIVFGGLFILNTRHRKVKIGLGFFLMLYLFVNGARIIETTSAFFLPEKRSELISSQMNLNKSKIFAPDYFFFKQGENFTIRHPFSYTFYNDYYLKEKHSAKNFYAFNKKLNVDYVVLDERYLKKGAMDYTAYEILQKGDSIYQYRVVEIGESWKILERY